VRKGSPNVRPSGLRGMTPAYSDSPLSKKGYSSPDEDPGAGTAE
jgi:hypothetical protein